MPDHRTLVSADVHEPKHITNTTGADAGKVITPLGGGTSELRKLALADLSDGGSVSNILNNDVLNYQGWENVVDGEVTTPTLSVDATPRKITVEDEGVVNGTNSDYLPRAIRGTGNLWDTATSKVTPIAIGDTYTVRFTFKIDSKTASPTLITATLDTGGLASPTIPVHTSHVSGVVAAGSIVSFDMTVFCLDTFKGNGGQVFLNTDVGSIVISEREILIVRTGSGNN